MKFSFLECRAKGKKKKLNKRGKERIPSPIIIIFIITEVNKMSKYPNGQFVWAISFISHNNPRQGINCLSYIKNLMY
jgi:hypothetical protein